MPVKRLGECLALLLFCSTVALAQNPELITLPEVSYGWDQTDELSFKAGTSIYYSISNSDQDGALKYIELGLIGDYQTSSKVKIGGGYKYRLVTPGINGYQYEHRLLEQVSFSGMLGDLKLSNRLRLEQRFRTGGAYLNRLRYRAAHKIALKANEGNAFLKVNDEFLYAFNGDGKSGENRLYLGYGPGTGSGSFEFGVQLRTKNFFTNNDLINLVAVKVVLGFSK